MSKQQVQQLLKDPEIQKILKSAAQDSRNHSLERQEKQKVALRELNSPISSIEFGKVIYDNLESGSDEESSEDNIALQLFDGEEMNVDMANFIGIHMLNELIDPSNDMSPISGKDDNNQINDKNPATPFIDPDTGAHFEYNDFLKRMIML